MEPTVEAVIFDLDGTLLDTESLCASIARQVCAKYGKTLTLECLKEASGKRPLDAWADTVRLLGIPVDPQVLLDESEPLLSDQWADAKCLPGAMRLLQHLSAHGVKVAVATSTPRATFDKKMSKKPKLRALLGPHVVCGNEVPCGKPAPDLFIAAAKALGVAPSACVVVEDAPAGVQAAIKAGMRVVVVPSTPDPAAYPQPGDGPCDTGFIQMLPSLMAFRPDSLGLPLFGDTVHKGVIPLDTPIHIKGTVVKGFGRGSRELGIPTANVDAASLHSSLCEAVTGIYAGWVSLGGLDEVYKTALSIGYNPHFGNSQKTCEPWILHEFDAPFYDAEIRLLVCAYIRPEAKYVSLQGLIDQILDDGEVSKVALEDPRLLCHRDDPFLRPPTPTE